MTFLTFFSLSIICEGRSSLYRDDSSDIYIILLDKRKSNEALKFLINTGEFEFVGVVVALNLRHEHRQHIEAITARLSVLTFKTEVSR